MKKIFLSLVLFSTFLVNAQEESKDKMDISEYKGMSLEGLSGIQFTTLPGNYNPTNYMFGLFPRYNFLAPKDWISLAASSPSQLGLNIVGSSSGSLIQFSADVPVALDLNIGARATGDNESLVGGFVGGGFNYNFTYFTASTIKINSHSVGPMVHAGFRWDLTGRPLGVRVAYMWGLLNNFEQDDSIIYEGNTYPTVLTINLLYGIR